MSNLPHPCRNGFGDRKRAVYASLLLLAAILFLPGISRGESSAGTRLLDAGTQFEFAEKYFENGNYFRAIGEYDRFIFLFPDSPLVEEAQYKIALSYLKGKRYQEAANAFSRLIDRHGQTDMGIRSRFGLSRSLVHLQKTEAAANVLKNLAFESEEENIQNQAYFAIGNIYLNRLLFDKAKSWYEKISPSGRNQYPVEKLLKGLEEKNRIKEKNPTLAGILALFPGAGYLYCNRFRDAWISFVVNSALMVAAYESFDKEIYSLGAILTVVETGFYFGNIYGSVSAAHKYNRSKKQSFVRQLQKSLHIGVSPRQKGIGLFVSFCF